ncbi:MAG: biopolymer transport protein TolQ [Thiomicrorhabdus sp.]|nr:MAG: biopolymer transport protein TolQ [Thiomicrorhabdus sp.]
MNDSELIDLVLNASVVVQAVMVLLAIMSLTVWAVAFRKIHQIRRARQVAVEFEQMFLYTPNINSLYQQVEVSSDNSQGMAIIFTEGYKEFIRLKDQGVTDTNDLLSGAQRMMKVAFSKESDRLERHLTILATVGSSAPYIGLFGTVWGVMHAFQSLGDVQHATLAAVAPGISEALIATAIGLFAAIPAVIAFNSLTSKADRLLGDYENFAEGLLTILQRQAYALDKKS